MQSLVLVLLIISLIKSIDSHDCSDHHQEIIKGVNLHQMHVPYNNHPFERIKTNQTSSPNRRRRSLLTEAETAPIRISVYYDPSISTSKKNQIQPIMGAISNYYKKLIRVIPIDGPWYYQRTCTDDTYSTKYGTNCIQYNWGSSTYKCISATVPDEHFAEQWLYNYYSDTVTVLPGGTGFQDTDLVLYITNDDTTSNCIKTGVLGAAAPCAYDQYGRPIAGNINICDDFFDSNEWKKDVVTMLHEMTHVTIMLQALWSDFVDPTTGDLIGIASVYDWTRSPPHLVSPILQQTVRDHFNCSTAIGLPRQSSTSSHWHMRYSYSETMGPSLTSQQFYYSKFTLALMEDSGWYLPDYTYADPFYFGENAGCDFLPPISGAVDCDGSEFIDFPEWFCDPSSDDLGCNQDNSAPGRCTLHSSFMMGCEIRDVFPVEAIAKDFESVCWDERGEGYGATLSSYESEIFAINSRCIQVLNPSSCRPWTGCGGFCYETNCYGWDDVNRQYAGAQITVTDGSQIIDCTRAMELTTVALADGTRSLICPEIDIVCGTEPNYATCYWGRYVESMGGCICTAGYTGPTCAQKDNSTDVEAIAATPEPTLIPSDVCILGLDAVSGFDDYNGVWTYVTDSEVTWVYPAYHNSVADRYLYWDAFAHIWYIADSVGGSTYYARCDVSYYTEDIADCTGSWELDDYSGWVADSTSISAFGLCVDQPTAAPSTPTDGPSKAPSQPPTTAAPTTSEPSKDPSQSPTTAEPTTAEPTDNPTTDRPTASPVTRAPTRPGETRDPTVDPTGVPTPDPTTDPTTDPTPKPTDNPTESPVTKRPTTPNERTDKPTTANPTTNMPTKRKDKIDKSSRNQLNTFCILFTALFAFILC